MSSSGKRFRLIGGLSASAAIAVIAVSAFATASQAQLRGSTMSMGSRGGSMMGNGGFRGSQPRFQQFNNYDGKSSRRSTGKGPSYSSGDDGGMRPPGRPPHGKRPHHRYPVVGPIIGTGVVVGTVGPTYADPPPPSRRNSSSGAPSSQSAINIPPNNEQRFVKDEVVLEFPGNVTPQQSDAVAARHRLTRLESAYFALSNTTYFRWRITDRRPVRTVLRQLAREGGLISAQPNYIYTASQQDGAATFAPPADAMPKATPVVASAGARPAAGDPAQYALAKLRLNEAHSLATGDKIVVAVIDSGIDLGHPELQGVVAGSFDALGKAGKPHPHGTAIAGAIAAHARLLGAAPAARILAIRAFGPAGTSVEATTFAILKSIDYAAAQNARVINMSFAGPADPGMSRQLAAAKAKGAVLIAASGNFGPKSPPQYPAADPNVIAVSATDANDKMFKASNIGPHIAVAAPGVDILLPAPDNDYQLISGTSFSAAYVSGVAALVLQRAPGLTPDAVRNILQSTSKDLGPRGKDAEYGAGLVDAYQAITAVQSNAAGGPQDAPQPVTAR